MEEPFIKLTKDTNLLELNKAKAKQFGMQCDIYHSANIISKLFFYWAFKVIRFANYTSLKTSYFGNIVGKNTLEHTMPDLHFYWNVRGYKNKKCCRLLSTSLRANIGK
jgi:hypothetical protein